MHRRRLRSCRANGRIERGRRGDKEKGRRTANNSPVSVVLVRIKLANDKRENDRTDNSPMVSNPASSYRKKVSNVVVDSHRMNDNRMKLNAVSNPELVNSPARGNQVSGSRANNRMVSSQDSLKAINLSADSNRGSNPVNVSRGKLKRANLNPASNQISPDSRVSNLKTVSVSRDNRNPDNAVSKARSD